MSISGGLDLRQQLNFKRSMRLWQPILAFNWRDDILIGKYARHYRDRLTKDRFLGMLRATSLSVSVSKNLETISANITLVSSLSFLYTNRALMLRPSLTTIHLRILCTTILRCPRWEIESLNSNSLVQQNHHNQEMNGEELQMYPFRSHSSKLWTIQSLDGVLWAQLIYRAW